MTKPTKKYIMRSYVSIHGSTGLPVLRYVVANNDTGKIVQLDLGCEEAERFRDQLNHDERNLTQYYRVDSASNSDDKTGGGEPTGGQTTANPTPAYPAQAPHALSSSPRSKHTAELVDKVMALLTNEGIWAKRLVFSLCTMRAEYEHHRVRSMVKK